jgi:PAS domain S-box-containing protein
VSSDTSLFEESLVIDGPESLLGPVPSLRAGTDLGVARASVQPTVSRYLFATLAVIGALGALLVSQLPHTLPDAQRLLLLLSYGLVTLLGAVATRVPARHVEAALSGVVALTVITVALTSVFVGWGLGGPGLSLFSLLACILCALARRRVALPVVGVMALALVGVYLHSPAVPLPVLPHAQPVLRLVIHLLLLVGGVVGGLMIAGVVARHMRAADEREHRFRSLLAIAADAYWEIDEKYRLVAGTSQRSGGFGLAAGDGLGQVPWDLPQFGCDDETLDLLQADLDTRAPFRNLPMQWRSPSGTVRHLSVSGEPRFDERGVFCGYWGVVRDVTADLQARQALAATETRYQELFSRIPTPLVMHRAGRVIDANPAAWRCSATTRSAPWSAATCWPATKAATRASASAAASTTSTTCPRQGPAGDRLPHHRPRGPARVGAGHQRACGRRRRPRGAVDLCRRHRAPRRRGSGAPVRGHAVAPGGHQPRRHHADRPGDRALRHGQPDLRAHHRLHRGRGGGPHLGRTGHLAGRRAARRLRPAACANRTACRTSPPSLSPRPASRC